MRKPSMTRAMLAGFIGTVAMTFLGFIASRVGVPIFSWAKAFSGYLGGNPLFGYFMFFVGGVLLAMVYVGVFHDRLPGHSWKRGLFFAVMMWILTGAALAPLMHMGFFMGSVMLAMGTLASYMLYGAILGYLYDA
jgi:uncharacterized protein DUF6789